MTRLALFLVFLVGVCLLWLQEGLTNPFGTDSSSADGAERAADAAKPGKESSPSPQGLPKNMPLYCGLKQLARPEDLAKAAHASARCAIVSSSGDLLRHANGAEIDSHDIVVRVNAAPILDTFERHVGMRDDVRVIECFAAQKKWLVGLNRSSSETASSSGGRPNIWVVHPGREYNGRESYASDAGNGTVPFWQELNFSADLSFETLSADRGEALYDFMSTVYAPGIPEDVGQPGGRKAEPSTGSHAIFGLLARCGEVTAYGFADPRTCFLADHFWDRPPNVWLCWLGLKRDGCENGNLHNFHALRPAEHDLWEEVARESAEVISRTGRLTMPGFAKADCDGVDASPAARYIDMGTITKDSDGKWNRYHPVHTHSTRRECVLHPAVRCGALAVILLPLVAVVASSNLVRRRLAKCTGRKHALVSECHA